MLLKISKIKYVTVLLGIALFFGVPIVPGGGTNGIEFFWVYAAKGGSPDSADNSSDSDTNGNTSNDNEAGEFDGSPTNGNTSNDNEAGEFDGSPTNGNTSNDNKAGEFDGSPTDGNSNANFGDDPGAYDAPPGDDSNANFGDDPGAYDAPPGDDSNANFGDDPGAYDAPPGDDSDDDSHARGVTNSVTISNWEHERRDDNNRGFWGRMWDGARASWGRFKTGVVVRVDRFMVTERSINTARTQGAADKRAHRSRRNYSNTAVQGAYNQGYNDPDSVSRDVAVMPLNRGVNSGGMVVGNKGNGSEHYVRDAEQEQALNNCLSARAARTMGKVKCQSVIENYEQKTDAIIDDANQKNRDYHRGLRKDIAVLDSELADLEQQLSSAKSEKDASRIKNQIEGKKLYRNALRDYDKAQLDSHGCIIGQTIWQPDHNACLSEVVVGNYCRRKGGIYHGRGGCTCSNGRVWTRAGCVRR